MYCAWNYQLPQQPRKHATFLHIVLFSIVAYEIQGKYISWFLLQGSSVSSTEKNNISKINIFFRFPLQYLNNVCENYQKSTDSPSYIRIMECSIAFSCGIIRKDKDFFFLEAILLPMVLLRNKEFSFQLILKEISKIYIASLWITANFTVVRKLYIWVQ